MNKALFASESTEWETPPWVFDQLNKEFGFTLDPCATRLNRKCEKYFDKEQDGLKQDWGREIVFMNPPYGNEIKKWTRKALEASKAGATVVCLLPARTDTVWFHELMPYASDVRFVKGRLKFVGGPTTAPFPSVIIVLKPSETK